MTLSAVRDTMIQINRLLDRATLARQAGKRCVAAECLREAVALMQAMPEPNDLLRKRKEHLQ